MRRKNDLTEKFDNLSNSGLNALNATTRGNQVVDQIRYAVSSPSTPFVLAYYGVKFLVEKADELKVGEKINDLIEKVDQLEIKEKVNQLVIKADNHLFADDNPKITEDQLQERDENNSLSGELSEQDFHFM